MSGRTHLRVHADDNVVTLLDRREEETTLEGGSPSQAGVPFGHKVALAPIRKGESVIKYGVAIGQATRDIAAGEHVHVHNCA